MQCWGGAHVYRTPHTYTAVAGKQCPPFFLAFLCRLDGEMPLATTSEETVSPLPPLFSLLSSHGYDDRKKRSELLTTPCTNMPAAAVASVQTSDVQVEGVLSADRPCPFLAFFVLLAKQLPPIF